jgi:hypothetical protein
MRTEVPSSEELRPVMAINISPLVKCNHAWQQRHNQNNRLIASHIRELKFQAVKNSDQ